MVKKIKILLIFLMVMLTNGVLFALPQSPGGMDGDFADWKGGTGGPAACFADDGGVDETNLNRADITEYCLHIDPDETGGLYLLMAIDDTEPKNDADVRIVVDTDGNQTPDYSVGNSFGKNGLSIDGTSISSCSDAECTLNQLVLLCKNGGSNVCTGTTEGFNNNWPSQFTSSKCDGSNCATLDGFIEIFVPWQWLGGTPPGSYLYGVYLSSHSGGTEDSSSDNTGQGVACNESGCYTSGPTAVSLQSFYAVAEQGLALWLFLLTLLLSSVYLVGMRVKRPF